MTAVALRAVLTQVPVVFVMTCAALLRHFHRARRLHVAGDALQFGVRAEQGEMRLFGVVEYP